MTPTPARHGTARDNEITDGQPEVVIRLTATIRMTGSHARAYADGEHVSPDDVPASLAAHLESSIRTTITATAGAADRDYDITVLHDNPPPVPGADRIHPVIAAAVTEIAARQGRFGHVDLLADSCPPRPDLEPALSVDLATAAARLATEAEHRHHDDLNTMITAAEHWRAEPSPATALAAARAAALPVDNSPAALAARAAAIAAALYGTALSPGDPSTLLAAQHAAQAATQAARALPHAPDAQILAPLFAAYATHAS